MENNKQNTTGIQSGKIYVLFADIIGYYLIPCVCAIGIILNIFLSIMLKSNKLKHSFYKYIFIKTLIDTIVCIFGVTYSKSLCIGCAANRSYEYLFHQFYIITINTRVTSLMSSISEVYLIPNRYLILKNIQNCLFDIKLRYYVPLIILLPLFLLLPVFFSFYITHEEDTNFYKVELNDFGESLYFKVYLLTTLVPEIFLPVIILTILSILSIRAYHDRIGNQAEAMSTSIERLHRLEKRHTRIAIILTILFLFSRTCDSIGAILIRLYRFRSVLSISNDVSVLNAFRQATLFISFCMHAFSNICIIAPMDKNLMKLIKGFFKSLKVKKLFFLIYFEIFEYKF